MLNNLIRRFSRHLKLAAVGAVIAVVVASGAIASTHLVPTTVYLWIDANGGTCTPQATSAYSDAAACSSLGAAYSAVPNGTTATVTLKCGTYAGIQTFTGSRTGGMITYTPASTGCVTLVPSVAGNVSINFNSADWVTLDGLDIGRVATTSSTTDPSQHVTLSHNTIVVGQKTNGVDIQLYASQYWTITGNTVGPSCCGFNGGAGVSPEGIRIGKPNASATSCATEACNVTVTDNLIQYVGRNCAYWPSAGYGACPDTTCPNTSGCHPDGIHVWGLQNSTISRNRLYGVECQGIFFEQANGSLNSGISIEGNNITALVGGCGNKGIYVKANLSNSTAGTWNIRFNSGTSLLMLPNGCGGCMSGTTWNIAGNAMILNATNASGNNGGCGAGAFGSSKVHWDYNVWAPAGTNAACGTHDKVAVVSYANTVKPPALNIDGHLGPVGPADNYVPVTVAGGCPTMDIDGQTPPPGSACDAGADQR